MTADVEIFFDLSSPWTRLAFHNFRRQAQGLDLAVRWRPFLVGGVFNAVNKGIYQIRAEASNPRYVLSGVWLLEWARLAGVRMNFPSPHHPVRSVHAMRFCCALEDDQAKLLRFAEAAFEAYFGDQRNLDDEQVLIDIADQCGLDGRALAARTQEPAIKDRLRANTQDAIDRGAFGSPTFFVGKTHQYFGNDQLPLVFQRIALMQQGG